MFWYSVILRFFHGHQATLCTFPLSEWYQGSCVSLVTWRIRYSRWYRGALGSDCYLVLQDPKMSLTCQVCHEHCKPVPKCGRIILCCGACQLLFSFSYFGFDRGFDRSKRTAKTFHFFMIWLVWWLFLPVQYFHFRLGGVLYPASDTN